MSQKERHDKLGLAGVIFIAMILISIIFVAFTTLIYMFIDIYKKWRAKSSEKNKVAQLNKNHELSE